MGRGRADVGLGSGKVGVGSLLHAKRACLPLEPKGHTNNADLEGLVGFPWLLEFSRRKAEDESGMLAFLNHHVLFDSVWRQCIKLRIEDIWIAELNFTPSSLCCMNVLSVGKWVSLWERTFGGP